MFTEAALAPQPLNKALSEWDTDDIASFLFSKQGCKLTRNTEMGKKLLAVLEHACITGADLCSELFWSGPGNPPPARVCAPIFHIYCAFVCACVSSKFQALGV